VHAQRVPLGLAQEIVEKMAEHRIEHLAILGWIDLAGSFGVLVCQFEGGGGNEPGPGPQAREQEAMKAVQRLAPGCHLHRLLHRGQKRCSALLPVFLRQSRGVEGGSQQIAQVLEHRIVLAGGA